MKKFTPTEIAILVIAPAMLALPKEFISKKISRSVDSVMPMPNYTMVGNNVMSYDALRFAKPGVEMQPLDFTIGSIFQTLWQIIVPSSVANKFQSQSYGLGEFQNLYDTYKKSSWTQPVDILDARELENDFNRTGFDLLTDDEFAAFEWDKMGQPDVQQKLHDIMAPHVHKYYPNATRIFIGPPIKRNALSLKATNGPHMDYVPNDEQRNAFYKVNRAPEYQEVVQCLLGNCDTDHDELGLILGAWVPTIKTPVCDKPFAVVSADSSSPEDVSVISATIPSTERFGKSRQQMFAIINHEPNHKWYYYPYQKPNEMLLFHHWNSDKRHVWGNAHSGFQVSGCGDEYDTRGSIEMRIAVFFEKDTLKKRL